jgi:outer membrane lipoprotein carrier protein
MPYFLILLLLSFATPLHAEDLVSIKTGLQKKYQSINAWQTNFVQETHLDLLDKTVKKTGMISAKKPGKIKIEYIDSPRKTYISNGKKLWIYSPDQAEVMVIKKISQMVASEALDFLNGLGELDKQFEVMAFSKKQTQIALIKNKNLNFLELVPRDLDSVLDRIVLAIDPTSGEVKEMTLFNESGNKTHYSFTNMNFNPDINDSFFEFVKPAGVKEINQ